MPLIIYNTEILLRTPALLWSNPEVGSIRVSSDVQDFGKKILERAMSIPTKTDLQSTY